MGGSKRFFFSYCMLPGRNATGQAWSWLAFPCDVTHNSIECDFDIQKLEQEEEPELPLVHCVLRVALVLATLGFLNFALFTKQFQSRPAITFWIAVIACGSATGISMATYQLVLNASIDFIWGTVGSLLERSAIGLPLPLIIPPLLLGLTAVFADRLPNGGASLFVKSVLHDEVIPIFVGFVGIPLTSITAITSGGSAGPEGPVLPIGGSVGAWYWRFVEGSRSRDAREPSRALNLGDLILVGGCASIAAFFDDVISGCIFVMEVPHLTGLQRSHALPAALIASFSSWFSHRLLMVPFGIEYSPKMAAIRTSPNLGFAPAMSIDIVLSVPCGLLAGVMSIAFIRARQFLDPLPFPSKSFKSPLLRGMTCGLIVGAFALLRPHTLMWGEAQLDKLSGSAVLGTSEQAQFEMLYAEAWHTHWLYALSVGLVKFVTIVITTTCGYPAGIVFPLILVGYFVGGTIGASPLVVALFGSAYSSVLPQTLGACVGSAFLSGVMHVPLGTALLCQRMTGCDAHGFAMLLIANYVSCFFNPLTIFKQENEARPDYIGPVSPMLRAAGTMAVKPVDEGGFTAVPALDEEGED